MAVMLVECMDGGAAASNMMVGGGMSMTGVGAGWASIECMFSMILATFSSHDIVSNAPANEHARDVNVVYAVNAVYAV